MAKKENEVITIDIESNPKMRHAIKDDRIFNTHGRINRVFEDETFNVKIGYNFFYFVQNDMATAIKEHMSIKDNVFAACWYDDENFPHLVRFINHTKGLEIVNSEYVRCIKELDEKRRRREMHHKILFETLKNGGDLFMLAKQVKDQTVLVDVTDSGYPSYEHVIEFLHKNGINDIDEWIVENTPLGELIQVPGHEGYLFGAFHANEKRRDCKCGAESYSENGRNHTIKSNSDWYCMCEYCFFDKMRITVPEDFYESMEGKMLNV